jgi:hypothetical protein
MERTHDYLLIKDGASEIGKLVEERSTAGWRPILMSTATVGSEVQVFIVFEKSIPAPYLK